MRDRHRLYQRLLVVARRLKKAELPAFERVVLAAADRIAATEWTPCGQCSYWSPLETFLAKQPTHGICRFVLDRRVAWNDGRAQLYGEQGSLATRHDFSCPAGTTQDITKDAPA